MKIEKKIEKYLKPKVRAILPPNRVEPDKKKYNRTIEKRAWKNDIQRME